MQQQRCSDRAKFHPAADTNTAHAPSVSTCAVAVRVPFRGTDTPRVDTWISFLLPSVCEVAHDYLLEVLDHEL